MKSQWPADKVERRSLASLIPYAKNARTHSKAQIGQIAKSIEEWGWTVPVLVDEGGNIIAGHGRVLAAQSIGLADVPVVVAVGWSDTKKRAYVLADNKLAENAGWDLSLLGTELTGLGELGFDLGLVGFTPAELGKLIGGARSPDVAPSAPVKPVTRLGDLWRLGKSAALCGDSCASEAVSRALGDVKPHLMVTDPPYGVDYDPNWRNSADRSTANRGRKIGATAVGRVQNDERADWSPAWMLFPGDVAYVWHAGRRASDVQASLIASGYEIRSQIIWNKSCHIIGRGDYHFKHEPCWYAVRNGARSHFNRHAENGRKQNTVWDIDHRASETGHSTQKPVECMRRPILNNSNPGDAVYDPFLGSGTTIIAAEMEGRTCIGLEIDPAYCDVVVQRWQTFTGKEAILDGTEATFAEIASERGIPANKHGEERAPAL